MRLAMSDELATDDDPTAEGFEVDTFALRGPGGPDSDDEDDPEAKRTSKGTTGAGRGVPQDDVVFEIGDEEEDADEIKVGRPGGSVAGRGERQGLMSSASANGSDETLVPPGKRADKND